MASKTQKNNGYLLPDPVDGYELICVKLMIPNDPTYIANFTGHLHELAKWWTWEKSNVSGDTRATDAAAYWRKLLYTHLTIGDCGPTEHTCTDYAPSAPIVSYFPADPFKDPDLRPFGYLLPPFIVVQHGDLINAFLGYLPGDVITTISRIPLATGGLLFPGVSGWPKITIKLPTGGDLSLKLLSIESGGLARIIVDGKQVAEEDLEYLELQFPVQSTKEVDVQLTLENGQPHTVEIRFDPKIMLTPPFLGFGGGLRGFTFCTDETFNDALERAAKRLNAPYTEVDLEMPRLEVDCDCQAFIVCDDGTRKKLAFADDVPQIKAEVEGKAQPTPGGGTASYCKKLFANQKLLISAVVSTGDLITITSVSGSGNDGVEGYWRWINGKVYFASIISGDTITQSTDPVPTAPHMSLIVNIGGTFHAFTAGSFTVPSGVNNAQVYFQVNDDDLTNNNGDYDLCVTVANNQSVPSNWSHTIDFTLATGIFTAIPYAPAGSFGPAWSGSSGWRGDNILTSGIYDVLCSIEASWGTATEIDSIEVYYDSTSDYGVNHGLRQVGWNGSGYATITNYGALDTGSGSHHTIINNVKTGVTSIQIYNDASLVASTDTAHITKIVVSGVGFNPFV